MNISQTGKHGYQNNRSIISLAKNTRLGFVVRFVLAGAEIGQNAQGNLDVAKFLISEAKENGADLVKFQLYSTDLLYEKDTELYQLAKEAELTFWNARDLFYFGEDNGIGVFFSVFDLEKVDWCKKIGVKRYKIAYSQRWNYPLLKSLTAPVIISTDRDDFLKRDIYVPMSFLYCIPNYPAEIDFEGVNFFLYSGYSDHTIGLNACKIALARGARIIEKHFCVNHSTGVDAPWSMDAEELKDLKTWENLCQLSQ